jgi:hypothetical protein
MFGGFFKNVGIIVCAIVFVGSGWELLALVTGERWPPTFSNLTQGLREAGHQKLVFAISIAAGVVLMVLAQWLYYHFNYEAKTNN